MLAGTAAALLALPASWTDYAAGHDGSGPGPGELTPYPPMLPVLIAVLAVAGVVCAVHAAAARVAAVVAGLAALQVGGIALVAHRDWWNFAGADGASFERAAAGSLVAAVMGAVAATAVVVSVLLYRTGRGVQLPRKAQVAGGIIAGAAIAVVVPVLLCAHWNYTSGTAAGQFALWWSLPWGAGMLAAGTLRDGAARHAAFMTVLVSAFLALLSVIAPAVHGFGIRLPG
ncbi:hypothetical protein Adu01nite_14920 [Paractinoplanes durhamensis]|uniref:Uncharacterized protein n=1 Tax=Paractinoplanes durhamensis TaxID=113563 RepID=A0ABQ3YRJ3_9ACTN|nr:hypothetical protein Adu01nite_14920 [Actinoplanes durhamensis]